MEIIVGAVVDGQGLLLGLGLSGGFPDRRQGPWRCRHASGSPPSSPLAAAARLVAPEPGLVRLLHGQARFSILPAGDVAAAKLALALPALEIVIGKAAADPQLATQSASRQRGAERCRSGREGGAVVVGEADVGIGGKRVNGAVKEKKGRRFDLGGVEAEALARVGDRRRELMARQKRNSDAEKKRTSMATRGGRIVMGRFF